MKSPKKKFERILYVKSILCLALIFCAAFDITMPKKFRDLLWTPK